jgi:predicted nucleotidyltransferase
MEQIQIKKAIKAGNSSAVILPRSWLNKEVRVELARKTNEMILNETLSIIRNNHIELKEIIGIYLTGSYARGEEDTNSDIDVLVITRNTDKELIKDSVYNIFVVSLDVLKRKLKEDLLPLGQMIKEAKALLNSDFLESFDVTVNKKNVLWHIQTTQEKFKMIEEILEFIKSKKQVPDRVIYTLVLRIRSIYIINCLIKNKSYSKNNFVQLINKVSHGNASYQRYLAVKNDLKQDYIVSLEEAQRLYFYLKRELEIVKKRLG